MKLKIINRKKFIKSISIIVSFSIVILIGSHKIYSTGGTKYKEEYISQGDTLWEIAEREASENEYYRNKDIRDIIQDIKKLNQLENSNLYEGQQIRIPM